MYSPDQENTGHLATEAGSTRDPAAMRRAVDKAASEAGARIAPLWPLSNFVAVNPLLGVAGQTLSGSARTMAKAFGARLTMPRAYYASLLDAGRIQDRDIAGAIAELAGELGVQTSVERVRAEVLQSDVPVERFRLPTVATLAARRSDVDWPQLIEGAISNWAADFFDQGIAVWSAAPTHADPWSSYREVASIDRSAELLGLKQARQTFASLPTQPIEVLTALVERLQLPDQALVPYFHRLLADVAGWAGYARYRGWTRELRGEEGSAARQLLAIRAAWELVLLSSPSAKLRDSDLVACCQHYLDTDSSLWRALSATDQVLQLAFERVSQRELAADIETRATLQNSGARPEAQAVFCIDVRSERLRRALEAGDMDVHTLGFAGFFGLAVEVESATEDLSARCPVLLEPGFESQECTLDQGAWKTSQLEDKTLAGRWARFQRGGVAGFGYVEALGLGYLWKLGAALLGSKTQSSSCDGHHHTLNATLSEKVSLAEGMLRGMSLTRDFAPLVVFAGHGSTTTNNPHASALDCGACGGHAGDINARLAAQLLNDRFVRAGLLQRGIDIPSDTAFAAALHDTTTDEVRLLDTDSFAEGHQRQVEALEAEFARASAQVRAERAADLGVQPGKSLQTSVIGRAGDWSQVRPEWGLAGCYAFIAAPRTRTRGLSLEGRSFLHEYRHQDDNDYGVLETILTAPLVVASWITLQYYGSTVDNRCFGSGDKTLHNVVSGIGVLEGVGGDLRSGLPMQSLHDGQDYIHEPLRLSAVIEAPRAAIDRIVEKHEDLARLVDNGWIQMHAIDDAGALWRRPRGGGNWVRVIDRDATGSQQSEAA